MITQQHVAYCREKAAKVGSSNYYSLLFSPNHAKNSLLGIFAMAAELRDIPRRVSDPRLANIKLAWWKSELDNAAHGNPSHPATACIGSSLLSDLPTGITEGICESYTALLNMPLFFTEQELKQHCLKLSGGLFLMAAKALGISNVRDVELIQNFGANCLALTYLLNIGKMLNWGWHPIPVETLQKFAVPVEGLRNRLSSEPFLRLMAHTGQEAMAHGNGHWQLLSHSAQLQARPLRAMWRMRVQEWAEYEKAAFPMLTQGIRLTPLRKFFTAWTTHALRR